VAEGRQNDDWDIAALRLKFEPQFLGVEKFVGSTDVHMGRPGDRANVGSIVRMCAKILL
jgi:hypothetical protein